MSQTAHHLENGTASPSENGVEHLAAADAAKADANAHFKGLCILHQVLRVVATGYGTGQDASGMLRVVRPSFVV